MAFVSDKSFLDAGKSDFCFQKVIFRDSNQIFSKICPIMSFVAFQVPFLHPYYALAREPG